MKYFKKIWFIPVLLMFGLMACVNNNNSSNKTEIKTIDTAAAKTIIVDVRTTEEWMNDGHADCSVNYPLDELETKAETLKAFDKVIVVCRSGSRADAAKDLLEQAGIKNVENKGAWQNINCK